MSRLKWLGSLAKLRKVPGIFLLSFAFVLGGSSALFGQDFTLTATAFNPYAINQGGSTLSTVTLNPVNGFSGTVALTCTVTGSGQNMPVCQVSPSSVAAPATASLTFTGLDTSGASATPGGYSVTVTGTSGSLSHQQSLNISVLAVAPSFTVTVQRPIQPTSVHAGSGATAIININPVNGYTQAATGQGVWLSCATISPLVIYPPTCSFSPQPAPVNGITPVTMTVTAQGNAQQGSNAAPHSRFFALWLPLPMLAFAGIGAAGSKRSRKAWALLGLFILAGSLMLVPGCGNTTTGNTAPTTTVITPKNTYTFTLTGVDSTGTVSTNSGTGAPTVTLTVD